MKIVKYLELLTKV